MLATRVAALGLIGTTSRNTVLPILCSTVLQRRCVRSRPRSLCCRDSSRARLNPSTVGMPRKATSRRKSFSFLESNRVSF
jgi:hypothetical protein